MDMDFNTFQCMVDTIQKKKAILFALEHDSIPDIDEIKEFEREYKIQLPEKYVQFLTAYGGGYFGYTIAYSLDKNSSFFVFNHNVLPLGKYLYIADNECGDYYAFEIRNGKCCEALVFYEHESGKVYDTDFPDILEYLIKVGLKSQI